MGNKLPFTVNAAALIGFVNFTNATPSFHLWCLKANFAFNSQSRAGAVDQSEPGRFLVPSM